MNLRSDKKQYLVFWVVEDVPTDVDYLQLGKYSYAS